MIVVDGSHGEGGGAMLRQALALSIITGKPFRMLNIRKSRPRPGLQAQHVSSIDVAKQLCGAKVVGCILGSQEIEFYPGIIDRSREIRIDIGTAGSITALLQSVFLPAVFSGKNIKFDISGGTDVSWSPSADYFENVFLPIFRDYADVKFQVIKRGYYPKGGGNIRLVVNSKKNVSDIKYLDLNRNYDVVALKGKIHVSLDMKDLGVAEKMRDAADIFLAPHKADIYTSYDSSLSSGGVIFLYAIISFNENEFFRFGSDALLDKSMNSEKAAESASKDISKVLKMNAVADKHLSDQLIPLLALSSGSLRIAEATNHVISNIYVSELFTGKKIKIDGNVASLNF